MGKDYAEKICAFKCGLEELIAEYAQLKPSERVAAAMIPLIECWEDIDRIGARMRQEAGLSDEDLTAWLHKMQNVDGTHGAHWTEMQTKAVGDSIGINWQTIAPKQWNLAMNMMYSDYWAVAEKYKQTSPEFYAELAKAFLFDPDSGEAAVKLAGYYHGIVAPNIE